ncbi:MAG: ferrous iron transporter B [Fusobacteriaceae bacterium]|jgi:ferrous iron transport protein B|nr:ferrous iron transporter B [Fusobacteriaceae bacterium]
MNSKIALVGNPNSGKTTLFNALTGSNQFVGNWPGVTVEKKEGRIRGHQKSGNQKSDNQKLDNREAILVDLPGIYSLSPYTLEEVVSRNYLIDDKPDAIINIIDGSNLERNLYLTTQLVELGIPIIVAVNMIDVIHKNGDILDIKQLSKELGCDVVEISALKNEGLTALTDKAISLAESHKIMRPQHEFSGSVEHAIAHIEEAVLHDMPDEQQRWFAIKLFERDKKIIDKLKISQEMRNHIEKDITNCEEELDDDAESIITNERYIYIASIIGGCFTSKSRGKLTNTDKIDRIVTNRVLALPIFVAVMFIVYFVSVTTIGTWVTDWANDGVFGDGWRLFGIGTPAYEQMAEEYNLASKKIEAFKVAIENAGVNEEDTETLKSKSVIGLAKIYDDSGNLEEEIPVNYSDYEKASKVEEPNPSAYGTWIPGIPSLVGRFLEYINCAQWLQRLILDGIIAGVGAVLGFVPQMFVLFIFLAILEDCGYMARIAFIMDRIFRKFGLSGKSFIPILIGTGCGVPGLMASRTIENDRDRRMTIITTTFIPCSAKLPIIALISGALFGGVWWIAPSAYFLGILAIITSGIMLKKTTLFAGEPAPFVMELPPYHIPALTNVIHSMMERGVSFIKKAGTIILLATIFVWLASNHGFQDGSFGMVDMENSILASIGNKMAWIFSPIGWGDWRATVAAITGLIAKENVVGTFGILYGGFDEVAENGWEVWENLRSVYTPLIAYSFLAFNLICAPCFAAMGAIKREMNSTKWTMFAILYQCIFAYAIALMIYQFGMFFSTGKITIGVIVAVLVFAGIVYMLIKSPKENSRGIRSIEN